MKYLPKYMQLLKVLFLATMFFNAVVYASQSKLRTNAFLGVGIANVDHNNFLGDERRTATIIDASINATYSWSGNLSLNGQISYREFGDSLSDEKPRIDYLNITYVTNQLLFGEQTFSLGRVKNKMGIYNDFRDIPTAKPSILLPQSVYLDVYRNLFLSVDGLSINSAFDSDFGSIQLQLALGEINFDDSMNETSLGELVDGRWREDAAFLTDLRWLYKGYLVSFSYSQFAPTFEAAPNDIIRISPDTMAIRVIDGEVELTNYIYSFQKNWNNFELVVEYAYRNFEVKDLLAFPVGARRPMEGYYIQGRYHLNEKLTLLTRWERYFRSADDKKGERLKALGLEGWADHSITKSIGLKYQLNKRWSVFAEVHRITGSGYFPPFALPSSFAVENRDSILGAAELVYRF